MADITETAAWPAVPLLEPTDEVDATGGEDANANKQAKALTQRTAKLKEEIEALSTPLQGGDTFNGPAGRTCTHDLGHQNYHPSVTVLGDPEGTLGEMWVIKNNNTFVVYNSGTYEGPFSWAAQPDFSA